LAHNVFDGTAFDRLVEVLWKNRVLRRVDVQNFGFLDPTAVDWIVNRLEGRGVALEIPLPRVDLEGLIRNGMVYQIGLHRLTVVLGKVAAGDPGVQILPETRQRAETPPVPSYRVARRNSVSNAKSSEPERPFVPGLNEWVIDCERVPEPDIPGILAAFKREFALEALVGKIKAAAFTP
jgi:hypothetical protein